MDKDLQARATALAAEVTAKMADTTLTATEKSAFLDKADAENAEIAVLVKNGDRARQYRAGNDLTDGDGNPIGQKSVEQQAASDLNETFAQMKSAAASRKQGMFTYELGMKAQGVPGLMGEAANGTTAPAPLANGSYFLTGAGAPGIVPNFLPGMVDLRFYQLTIADLFSSTATNSPVVTYLRETAWANNAAAVAEGATKPTSTNAYGRLTEQVGKIANLARTTDEMIQDAPYFWSMVQARLPQGVKREEEVQLLAGAGMPGVNGLLNRSTGFTQGATGLTAVTGLSVPSSGTAGAGASSSTITSATPGRQIKGTGTAGTAPTGVQIAEGILLGLNDIRFKTFFEPDAILINPLDWYTVRVAKDAQGQYLGGSFFGTNYGSAQNVSMGGAVDTGLSLWGKRVLTTPVMPQGLVLMGAFKDGGTVLRMGGLTVASTNTNGTDFEQNLWTVRAEERVGLLVERPEVFELLQLANS
jgi:HK97 family phage major capsid protein